MSELISTCKTSLVCSSSHIIFVVLAYHALISTPNCHHEYELGNDFLNVAHFLWFAVDSDEYIFEDEEVSTTENEVKLPTTTSSTMVTSSTIRQQSDETAPLSELKFDEKMENGLDQVVSEADGNASDQVLINLEVDKRQRNWSEISTTTAATFSTINLMSLDEAGTPPYDNVQISSSKAMLEQSQNFQIDATRERNTRDVVMTTATFPMTSAQEPFIADKIRIQSSVSFERKGNLEDVMEGVKVILGFSFYPPTLQVESTFTDEMPSIIPEMRYSSSSLIQEEHKQTIISPTRVFRRKQPVTHFGKQKRLESSHRASVIAFTNSNEIGLNEESAEVSITPRLKLFSSTLSLIETSSESILTSSFVSNTHQPNQESAEVSIISPLFKVTTIVPFKFVSEETARIEGSQLNEESAEVSITPRLKLFSSTFSLIETSSEYILTSSFVSNTHQPNQESAEVSIISPLFKVTTIVPFKSVNEEMAPIESSINNASFSTTTPISSVESEQRECTCSGQGIIFHLGMNRMLLFICFTFVTMK